VARNEITRVATRLEHRAQPADDEDVQADDRRGQRAVDQRAVEQEIHVPQAVAQDGHGDGQRDTQEADRADGRADRLQQSRGVAGCLERRNGRAGKRQCPWPEHRHRGAEDDPLDLLALGRAGDAHVAVELGGHAQDEDAGQQQETKRHGPGRGGAAQGAAGNQQGEQQPRRPDQDR
jgi:hypothetical protein